MVTDIQDSGGNDRLEAFIRQEISERAGIPFIDYMHHCLYHPQDGYYMHKRQRIGSKGDFFTSSSVHKLFGRLIALQLVQMWELLGKGAFSVVEQGAGEGELAVDILDAIVAECPELYEQIQYVIVEISPDNCQRQKEMLRVHDGKVTWCAFDELSAINGCFISNELVDAFAVAIIEKKDGILHEVFVVEREGKLYEELRPVVSPQIANHFSTVGVSPVEGNRAEVCLAADAWIQAVAAKLTRGFVLTIDYGYPAQELYAPFRRQGTLLCYHQHQANDNPYQNIGRQDITSHVDFTALQKFGASAGLETLYFAEQYRFLLGLGFIEELIRLQAEEEDETKALALRMTLKNLIMPDGGMGETFKVLIQGKNVGTPQLLCARRLRDIPIEALAGM
jgi:SAM-dependent MidA family methyltransferase